MSFQLQPGEINFAFLPENWAYVCCNDKKQPTHTNWNKKPLSKSELVNQFNKPGAYQIGILCGPLFNEPEVRNTLEVALSELLLVITN